MSTRVYFEFAGEDPALWSEVVQVLRNADAEHINPPSAELPNIATAVLPDHVNLEDVMSTVQAQKGVGRVDVDTPREAY